MPFEHKPNTGNLFVNDKKERENQPDRKGEMVIVCPHCQRQTAFWQSGWIKQSTTGTIYLSQSFSQKEDRPAHKEPRADPPSIKDMQDDIPF